MQRPQSLINSYVHRAYICKDWELRITERCLTEDGLSGDGSEFETRTSDHIVSSFKKRFETSPRTSREVNKLSSGRQVWVVQAGGRLRGCAWHDTTNAIIWLLASHRHTSGSPDDCWPYFERLDNDDLLFPSEQDYKHAFREDHGRYFDALLVEAAQLLEQARQAEGEEVSATLVEQYNLGLLVSIVETLEERTIALTIDDPSRAGQTLQAVLVAFGFDQDLEAVQQIGGREINDNEYAYRTLVDLSDRESEQD